MLMWTDGNTAASVRRTSVHRARVATGRHVSMLDSVRYSTRALGLALLATAVCAVPALAQEVAFAAEAPTGPLLKTDLVRMMALGDYSDEELVHIVQMNCVAFRPTARDREDLLSLPGGQTVLGSIANCRASERQAAGFERGIPVARPVQGPSEAPAPTTELETATLSIESLDARPELTEPRFTMVIDETRDAVTATEVPPRLENWGEVSRRLLGEYRPSERKGGRVVIRVKVDESGRASDSMVAESSGDPTLDAAVLATVSVMRFTPAMSRDRRVSAWTDLPIQFETP